MRQCEISVVLPEVTMAAIHRIAAHQDISVGQFLRQAIGAEIRRSQRNAKTPNRADEQLLVSLRTLLAVDLAQATGWADLNARLEGKGFVFREAGGGLALHAHPTDVRLCKASELGYSYGEFMRRFGRPFPGHSHRHLADRLLGAASTSAIDDDFPVIERF